MAKLIDLVGRRFGKLLVLARAPSRRFGKQMKTMWTCRCDCGNTKPIEASNLREGTQVTCGCGGHNRRGPANPSWNGYGEISGAKWFAIKASADVRGIPFRLTIQEAWEQFVHQDRQCRFTGMHLIFGHRTFGTTASLDRIDSDGPYDRDNIQWVHKDVQRMKNVLDDFTFINLCKLIAKHSEHPDITKRNGV